MNGLFSADIENRGLILDPRTKLITMLVIVIFAMGGIGSDILCLNITARFIGIIPVILLLTAKKIKVSLAYGSLYVILTLISEFYLKDLHGAAQILTAIVIITVLRFMPGLIMGSYILSTTTVSEFVASLHRMHISNKITIPLSVIFRFFPTVMEEFSFINKAMRMRDITLFGRNRSRFIEYRLIPLLVCSANIGTELSAAALTRGLSAERKRTNICNIGFRLQDVILICISAIPFVLLILGKAGVIR